jgi:hypothetical protein
LTLFTKTNDKATDSSNPKLAAVPLPLLPDLSIFEHRKMHNNGNAMLKNGNSAVGTAFGFIGYLSLYNKLGFKNFSYGSANSNAKPMDNKTKRSATSNATRYRSFIALNTSLLLPLLVSLRIVVFSEEDNAFLVRPIISRDTNDGDDDEFRLVRFVSEDREEEEKFFGNEAMGCSGESMIFIMSRTRRYSFSVRRGE